MDRIKLTPTEMETLQAELAQMEGPKRAEIVEAIAVARGRRSRGELRVPRGQERAGAVRAAITILRAKLEDAEVIEGRVPKGG